LIFLISAGNNNNIHEGSKQGLHGRERGPRTEHDEALKYDIYRSFYRHGWPLDLRKSGKNWGGHLDLITNCQNRLLGH